MKSELAVQEQEKQTLHHQLHKSINDQKSLEWLTTNMNLLKYELNQLSFTLNVTAVANAREQYQTEISGIKGDLQDLISRVSGIHANGEQHTATITNMQEEISHVRNNQHDLAVSTSTLAQNVS